MMKTTCEEVEISGNKTNHSLRAYAASELFNAGVAEKVIQDRTGHRSLDGLRKYERISEKQKEAACKVLAVRPGPSNQIPSAQPQARDGHSVRSISSPSVPVTVPISVNNTQSVYQCQQNQQLVPSFSFGSASLHECTINQAYGYQLSQSEAQDLFEGQW